MHLDDLLALIYLLGVYFLLISGTHLPLREIPARYRQKIDAGNARLNALLLVVYLDCIQMSILAVSPSVLKIMT